MLWSSALLVCLFSGHLPWYSVSALLICSGLPLLWLFALVVCLCTCHLLWSICLCSCYLLWSICFCSGHLLWSICLCSGHLPWWSVSALLICSGLPLPCSSALVVCFCSGHPVRDENFPNKKNITLEMFTFSLHSKNWKSDVLLVEICGNSIGSS